MRFLALAAILLAPLAVRADETPTHLSPLQVTATRGAQPQLDVAQPLTVLTREAIARASPQVMSDLLRGQPGAFVQQTGPGQGSLIVRGLKGAELLHLVDGMRLNNTLFRTAPSQYLALVDPYNIAQLELLRGPYATLYGPDAMGGVVQLLTPEERFSGPAFALRGTALLRYGSASLSKTARLSAAVGNEDFSFAGGFSFMDYGSRRLGAPGQSPDGAGGTVESERVGGTAYRARGHDFKALWTPAGAHELMLSAQSFELPALPRYNELTAGFDRDGVPGPEFVDSVYLNARRFDHLRYRYGAPLGFIDRLELHLGQQAVRDDRRERATGASTRVEEFNRSVLQGLTVQAVSQLQRHRLSYGVDLYRDAVDSRRRDTDLDSGAVTGNGPGAPIKSRFPDGARSDNFGVYLIDAWQPDAAWQLDGGLRYNYTRTQLPQADRDLPASAVDDLDFAGNLGAAWRLTDALAWTVNAGRGFRAPNVNDLAQIGRRSGARVTIANPALKAERVSSIDSGLKFGDALWRAEFSLFYARYRDRITLVPTGNTLAEGEGGCQRAGGCIEAQNRNIASAVYYGVEAGARWQAAPPLALYASLNYTRGEQEDRGRREPANRVPPLNGQLGAEWQAGPRLRVEPLLYFAAAQHRLDAGDRADNRIAPGGTPGFAVAQLRLGWALRADLDLQLEGRNLFDQDYREHGSGIEGEGRGIVAGLRARLR